MTTSGGGVQELKAEKRGAAPTGPVETIDVTAVNTKGRRDLYAGRQKIYPKRATGTFRRLKWIVMAITLGIYYLLPWVRFDRGPDLPNQAVLVDLAANRYFVFFLEIWPQEFFFITGLLILAALLLFLITAVAGRVWCGYTCPQTVWTDLMIAVERFWQGDRNQRIRLDKSPWTLEKIVRKSATHISWILIAVATGGAFVFYFRDAPTLAKEFLSGSAPTAAYVFLALFTATTYLLGAIAREQVCVYMCPWPRIQGALVDHNTLLVGYLAERGEPRKPHKRNESWEGRGDCVDCKACVAVCPTGIDIRDGSQLECIQCALCVDACNEIMDKVGRPRGLVAYSTVARVESRGVVKHDPIKIVRPRTMLYAGVLGFVGAILLGAWMMRSPLELNVLRDRNPPFVRLSDGSIRNAYTIKILNKGHEPHRFALEATGLKGGQLSIAGQAAVASTEVAVATDELRELRVLLTLPKSLAETIKSESVPITLSVRDLDTGLIRKRDTQFELGLDTARN